MTIGQYLIAMAIIVPAAWLFNWYRSRKPGHDPQERPDLGRFERRE